MDKLREQLEKELAAARCEIRMLRYANGVLARTSLSLLNNQCTCRQNNHGWEEEGQHDD